MQVFVSWSGDDSKAIAFVLRDWIQELIPTSNLWVSATDIRKGTDWSAEVHKNLREGVTQMALTIVTPGNVTSAWLNYEAGALARLNEDGRVSGLCPILFGIKPDDFEGPLKGLQVTRGEDAEDFWILLSQMAELDDIPPSRLRTRFDSGWEQFQDRVRDATIGSEREDLWLLVCQIAELDGIPLDRVRRRFDDMWPDFEDAIARVETDPEDYAETPQRDPDDKINEILEAIRDVRRTMQEDRASHPAGPLEQRPLMSHWAAEDVAVWAREQHLSVIEVHVVGRQINLRVSTKINSHGWPQLRDSARRDLGHLEADLLTISAPNDEFRVKL